ncbi:PilZ domain protein [compost metagenome]
MSLDDRNYSEKRDFIRMRVQTKAILEQAGQQFPVLCLDLSSSGMQLEAEIALALGERGRVLIPSGHCVPKGLEADAEVVRISESGNGRKTLGLANLDMR